MRNAERVMWGRDLLSLGASANSASPDRQLTKPMRRLL